MGSTLELTVNPRTELVLRRERGELIAITVEAPIRGRSLQITTFSRASDPALFELLRRVAEKRGGVSTELTEEDHERLIAAGLLLPKRRVPRDVRFACPLAGSLEDDLAPRRWRAARGVETAPIERLRVNEGLCYHDEPRPPDATWVPKKSTARRTAPPRSAHTSPLARGCAWAGVHHPDAAVPSALSITGERERAIFRRLVPGGAAPEGLDAGMRAALIGADVLIDPDAERARRRAFQRGRDEASARFRRDRCAVVRGLLPGLLVAALRRYYRALVAEGYVCLGDPQVRLRYRAHNEPLARLIHARMAPFVAAIAGEPMIPSYVYFASYRAGSALKAHVDRPQCAVSVSLLVDYTPEPDDASPWPLYLKDASASGPPFVAALGLGDGVVYRGTELTHWRDALPKGHTSTSLFLHYVPEGFAGPLD